MKLRNIPRSLSNLSTSYELDAADRRAIKKYREEKHTKARFEQNTIRRIHREKDR